MSWIDFLISAQVSVNRAVFEANAPGRIKPQKIRPEYIIECLHDGIKELNSSLELIIKATIEDEK